jgi:CshA-type fibril repeat protein
MQLRRAAHCCTGEHDMIRTLDFNNLDAGSNVTEQFSDIGVHISAISTGSDVDQAMVFDTNNPTGNDADLATDNLDNVLIISEDGDASDPDDNANGGTFTFEFDEAVTLQSVTFLDLEQPAILSFFAEDGTLLSQLTVPVNGDNGQSVVDLLSTTAFRFEIAMTSSGGIDNLVFEDGSDEPIDDGIVSGDDEDNTIDLAYAGDPNGDRIDASDALIAGEAPEDDIVDALGGNDTIASLEGDDDVYAGAGDDVVLGGEGDDLIYGDRTLANDTGPSGERESFNWSEAGVADGEAVADFTQDTGSVNVTFTTLTATDKATTAFDVDNQLVDGIDGSDEAVDRASSLSSATSGDGEHAIYEISFDSPVSNVDFNINDIDGDSTVRVQAFDADNNLLEVVLSGGDNLTLTDTDGASGADTATSNGGYADADSPLYSLRVDVAGPVTRFKITHDQAGTDNTGINVTDVFFDADGGGVVVPVIGGDDDLFGDAGDDTIYGEAGDDTLTGGAGADSLSGGDDADLIVGGTAGDVIDGGTGGDDNDTLDLSDVGDFRLTDVTRDADGDSDSGIVEFLDDAGDVSGTLQFEEIETIIGVPTDLQPPFAVDDVATTDEDTAVTIDLIWNDTDADNTLAELTISDVSVPAVQGTVINNGDGTIEFTPAENFNGEATITYTVTDPDGQSDEGQAVVTVTPVNDAPIAVDDADVTAFNTSVTVDLLANDIDIDNPDDLVVTSATVPAGQGTLSDNGDGTFEFTPVDGFTGEATISYTISDGDQTASAIHTVTVEENQGPQAVDDFSETPEDTAVVVDLRGNDLDPNNTLDELTLSDIAVPAGQGTVVDNRDGTVTFTPAENFNGEATITYTITDPDGLTGEGQAFVTVVPVNDPPVANDDTSAIDEDLTVTISVLDNDTDPDADPLTVTEATSDDGTVVINDNGTIDFTPNTDFNGDAVINYTITDGNGGFDDAVVTVAVAPVNDAPLAEDDAAETPFETPVVVSVLDNDSDPDSDDLTIVEATSPDGEVTINDDGTLTFTPNDGFSGEAEINYTISDGELTDPAVLVVTVADSFVPVATDDVAETIEDTPVTINVLSNDTDPEDDPLTITEAISTDGTVTINDDGTLEFTPNPDFFGEAVIDYTITDGNGGFDDARVFVTVENANDAPVAADDCVATPEETPVTIPVLGNDTDPDGDALTVTAATSDDGTVVINDDGTITFTPNADFTGDAEIAYTITDGNGGTDDAIAKVSVGEVSDAPVAEDDTAETDEDTPVTIAVLANDTDADGDPLTVIAASTDDGTVTINDDGTIEFTPNPDFNGEATITYTITDGNGGEDTAEVTVTVNPVNDGPLAEDDNVDTPLDTPVTVSVLDNDSDPEGDDLTVISASSPDGEVIINDDGTLTFTPNDGFTGEAQVNYTISDGELTDPAVLFVDVGDGETPVAVDDVAETPEDTPITIPVLANDTDPNLDPLTVTEATSPDGTVTINDDGTIEFTPNPDFNGETTITYTITDPDGNEDTATVDVTVTPVNDVPVTVDDTAETNQDAPVIIAVLDNDSDPDGDPLVIVAATSPNGTVDINDDGTITFTPTPGFNGPAEITYSVSDGQGGETSGIVDVLVSDGIVTGTDGDDLIDGSFDEDPEGDVVDGSDGFLPGEGPEDDIINAGDGNDTVLAGAGNDDVSGGEGDDSLDGGIGDDELGGDEGDDTIGGGAGNDSINGGTGDDVLTGGEGDDTIVAGDGNDTAIGGDGSDVIDTSGGTPLPDIAYPGEYPADIDPENDRDSVVGGAGNDTITTGDDRDTIEGGAGDDVIDAGFDDDIVDGGDGDDRIVGAEGNDSITGGAGNDTIYANNDPDLDLDALEIEDDGSNSVGPDLVPNNGNDTVDGGAGNDVIFGGDDDDSLLGGAGDDLLDGGIDDDTLIGGIGNDTLIGGQGNDSLDAGQGDDTLDGGIGDDTMTGGADRDHFENVNAGDVVDGSETGDDFDTLDLTGSAPDGGHLEVTLDPSNAENGVVDYFNEDGTDAGQLIFSNIENVIPCFTPGTLIATPKGELKVEDLEVGDRIITRDNGMQKIRWIGCREMAGEELAAKEHLRPILIQQGALSEGLPERDMMVSPQHRVLVANDKTALYFEEREVLVAAKHLTDMDGVDVVDVSHTSYIHIMFDQHEVILSDGIWTESFQPGDLTLAGVGDASRDEILELFPELATREGIEAYAAARKSLKKHEAMLIIS